MTQPKLAHATDTTLVVKDMPDADYRAHPALSCSGAKRLLPPSCPAIYRWEQDHGQPDKQVFDVGHAAHQLVLGAGQPIARLDFDDRRTNAYKAAEAEARANGEVPLLRAEHDEVLAMAAAFKAHPIVGALFNPEQGAAEVSLFWHDEQTGVDRKARFDWLPAFDGQSRLIIPDYKSAAYAEPTRFAKAVADFGYHMQSAWYMDAAEACLDLGERPAFVFVVQEKTAPYLVTIVELDEAAIEVGRAKNARAMEVYRECLATGTWPGYSTDIELIGLPAWADRQYL